MSGGNANTKWLDRVICQITKAVSYLHTVQVLHNDIKSNNVVLHKQRDSEEPITILIDFGKATFVTDVPMTKKVQQEKPRHIASD